jgi:hypothetical protein
MLVRARSHLLCRCQCCLPLSPCVRSTVNAPPAVAFNSKILIGSQYCLSFCFIRSTKSDIDIFSTMFCSNYSFFFSPPEELSQIPLGKCRERTQWAHAHVLLQHQKTIKALAVITGLATAPAVITLCKEQGGCLINSSACVSSMDCYQ